MPDETIDQLRAAAIVALTSASDAAALDAWRVEFLGRKGRLTGVLRGLGDLSIDERKALGGAANSLKSELESAFDARSDEMRRATVTAAIEGGRVDVTLPARPHLRGRLHPVTQLQRRVTDVFRSMGFSIVEGPEVELDYYNFEALRIPPDHPARDMWDTMWIDQGPGAARSMLMRTHTSPAQIRIMEEHQPPIRVAVPGRAYRFEATDTTHEWMMTQCEILAIDEGLTMGHLKGTLLAFFQKLFGAARKIQLVCNYFPFVEPGAQVLMDCWVCNSAGCATCHQTGWIEMLGAGMVHPEILENMGIDSNRYTGFAAGMGLERLAMQYFGVPDIRYWYQNDLRLLRQF